MMTSTVWCARDRRARPREQATGIRAVPECRNAAPEATTCSILLRSVFITVVANTSAIRQIKTRCQTLAPLIDERLRRQWAGSEAQSYGRGGVSAIGRATGMSRNTIRKGIAEAVLRRKNPKAVVSTRVRRPGGGRKLLTESDPGFVFRPRESSDESLSMAWSFPAPRQKSLGRSLRRDSAFRVGIRGSERYRTICTSYLT